MKIYCPDCKIEMELITPEDIENYYKCPKCKLEIDKEEAESEE